MRFDDPAIRDAYRRGVRDAYDDCCLYLDGPQQRALDEWLKDLDSWQEGEPPPPPHDRDVEF